MKIESIQTGWTLVSSSVMAYLTPTHSAGSVIYKITENGKYYLVVGDNGYMGVLCAHEYI